MQVILLGGQSPRHYEWVREVREALEFAGLPVVLHDYAHWLNGEHEINFEAELEALALVASDIDDDYVIVAKSIGCVLTAVALARGLIVPKACLFLGLPFKTASQNKELPTGFAELPITIFAQNEKDPLGSFEEVAVFARPLVPELTVFAALAGSTHDYADFELIAALTLKLTKSLEPPTQQV